MKKTLAILLSLILALSCAAMAEGDASLFRYNRQEDGTLWITGYTGSLASPMLPAQTDWNGATSPVSGIAPMAFVGNNALVALDVPENISSIGSDAFASCTRLREIVLPDSLTAIEDRTFMFCDSLTTVTLPAGLERIGESAFAYDYNLQALSLPASVTEIGTDAFSGCDKLQLSGAAGSYAETYAEENNIPFTAVAAQDKFEPPTPTPAADSPAIGPDSDAETIGHMEEMLLALKLLSAEAADGRFDNATTQALLRFQARVNELAGRQTLPETGECDSKTLEYLEYYFETYAGGKAASPTPAAVTEPTPAAAADASDFSYSSRDGGIVINGYNGNADDLVIPAEINGQPVIALGTYAFSGGTFSTVEIPDSVTTLEMGVFDEADKLISVVIPPNVTELHDWTFAFCDSLTSVTLPEGLTSIGDNVFTWSEALETVNVPYGVTGVGDNAFNGCTSLTALELPDTVTSIGTEAFLFCEDLTSLTVPASVTSIGEDAFYGCPNLVLKVVAGSVAEGYATANSLQYELIEGTVPQGGGTPAADVEFSYTALGEHRIQITGYSGSTDNLVVPETLEGWTVTSLSAYAFLNKTFSSVELPDTITEICDGVFNETDNLVSIAIPPRVTSLGVWTFAFCDKLTSVTLPDGFTTIGDNVFSWSEALETVTVPETLTSIGTEAFLGCKSLKEMYIPASVTSIGENAFRWCEALDLTVAPGSYGETYAIANGITFHYADASVLVKGDYGADVQALQMLLVENGFMNDVADGNYGEKTEEAIKVAQTAAGYPVTGIADAATQAYVANNTLASGESNQKNAILFYALTRSEDGELHVCIKNLGSNAITAIQFRMFQCDESKNPLGDFYGRRNSGDDEYWTTITSSAWNLGYAGTDYTSLMLYDGYQVAFSSGDMRTVEYFVPSGYIAVELLSYTTEDGEEHAASQTLYCPFN